MRRVPSLSALAALAPSVAGATLLLVSPAAAQAHVLYQVRGDRPNQHLGYSVDGAGDVNDDGTPDLIVGELELGVPPAQHSVRLLSGVDGSVLLSPFSADCDHGSDVAGLGDIDGDGHSDVVLGLPAIGGFQVRSGASGDVLFSYDTSISFFGWVVDS